MDLIGHRYQVLEKIGTGGMGTVYRVHDRLRGQIVALKMVEIPSEDRRDTREMNLALAREFKTLSSLRHPNIVTVLDYGFHEQQPFFTMEYLDKAHPIDKAVAGLSSYGRVALLAEMLQALRYLHQRQVLHCDLKPSNVLVTLQQVVKLLDFGLAQNILALPHETEAPVMGTIAYLAPEVILGENVSVLSDLYAVGVLAYRVLTGKALFPPGRINDLLYMTLNTPPDLTMLPPTLAEVLARLLAKKAPERYATASETLEALCQAVEMAPPLETDEQQESFLQAAAFVGREAEFDQLTQALQRVQAGHGQLWLLGGESGIGKSRLLDELAIHALIDGFLVLRGQGVEGGGLPFQLWRDPLRRLIITNALSEQDASILKEIVPDIETLLEKPVSNAPSVSSAAYLERLAMTIHTRIQLQKQPILLILEDLQWTNESLELLKVVSRSLANLPIFIIGSYRREEAPTLPGNIPHHQLLLLDKLNPQAVSSLSQSMLGNLGGTVVELLQRETAGNPLFIVEVMRALAHEAGSLQQVMRLKQLPQELITSNIENLLRRRINQVPAWGQTALRYAAVLGRQLDLALLQALPLNLAFEAWLRVCETALVLEIVDETWRFTHDKVREVVLADIPPDSRKMFHRGVAEALEKLYPHDIQYAVPLAFHWQMADDAAGEFKNSVLAARNALQLQIIAESTKYFQRALELLPQITITDAEHAAILRDYGTALWRAADYVAAKPVLEQALAIYRNIAHAEGTAWVLEHLGTVLWRLGKYPASLAYLDESIAYAQQHDAVLLAMALNRKGTLYYTMGDYEQAKHYLMEALPVARAVNDDQALGNVTGNLGLIAIEEGQWDAAQHYLEEALRVYRRQGNVIGQTHALGNLGHLNRQRGDAQAARQMYQESIALAQRTSTISILLDNLAGLANLHPDAEEAVRWSAFIQAHPACDSETLRIAVETIKTRGREFSQAQRKKLFAEGAALQLEKLLTSE